MHIYIYMYTGVSLRYTLFLKYTPHFSFFVDKFLIMLQSRRGYCSNLIILREMSMESHLKRIHVQTRTGCQTEIQI